MVIMNREARLHMK